MKYNRKTILLLAATLLLTGCSSYKNVPYLQDVRTDEAETTITAPDNGTGLLYDARIMPKDLLTIVVSCPEEPALAEPFNLTVATIYNNNNGLINATSSQRALQQYLVDNQGNIEFPILGTLHLGGLTKGEAELYIREKLKPQFREVPIVTVRMVNYKITVLGEVSSPGTFTTSNEKINLFEALAMAGDMTLYGRRDNVQLIREDSNGQKEIIKLNLNDRDILYSPYYYMQQNDILYVTPNKTKAKNSGISTSNTIWFTVLSSLISVVSIVLAITR